MKKKPGPKGPRSGSAATLYKRLLKEGKSDAEVWYAVRKAFPGTRNFTKLYRWKVFGSTLSEEHKLGGLLAEED